MRQPTIELMREAVRALNAVPSFQYGDGRKSYDLAARIEEQLEWEEDVLVEMLLNRPDALAQRIAMDKRVTFSVAEEFCDALENAIGWRQRR